MQIEKTSKWPLIAVLITILVKIPFLFTHHIQEDAFITWRVAQNLLDYGVMGFNGETKISASTTHLYVFVSYFFNLIFGKEAFIEPLLIFNSLLFTIGSYFLSKMILKNALHQALFIFLFYKMKVLNYRAYLCGKFGFSSSLQMFHFMTTPSCVIHKFKAKSTI